MNSRIHKEIYQIVPRLPPDVDGVGDYALNLAHQLRLDFGINTHFLVCDPAWVGSNQLKGFQVNQVNARSTKSFLAQLISIEPNSPILLHYVGYGYAKRGCPTWLVDGLELWKHQCQQAHLVTMFHEISAFGPIWTSAFWLSATQRYLVKRLVRLSDRILTSKQLYAGILQSILAQQSFLKSSDKLSIPALPVFSTVGEPKIVLPLDQRDPTLVIFGGLSRRSRIYQHCQNELIYACEQLMVERILDIGPADGFSISSIGGISVDVLGPQPASVVSQTLSFALAGFIYYAVDFLGKSTIFASYCAHGVLPIVWGAQKKDVDGLKAQSSYWLLEPKKSEMNVLLAQEIASNAHAWYQSHNLSKQSHVFANALKID